jgi:hypothetical protein
MLSTFWQDQSIQGSSLGKEITLQREVLQKIQEAKFCLISMKFKKVD